MRNSVVNSIGRNLEVSPAQVADLLYIGHFFRKFFLYDVSNTRFSCVGQSSEVIVCFQSPQGQLQQFPLQKVHLTIFQEVPNMAKWSTWVFPFRSPCSTAGWTRLLNYELIIDYEIMKDM